MGLNTSKINNIIDKKLAIILKIVLLIKEVNEWK